GEAPYVPDDADGSGGHGRADAANPPVMEHSPRPDKGLVRAHIDGYFCAFVSDLATALLQNTHPDRPGKTRCSELGVATVALPRCRAEPYSLAVWYLFLGGHWHLAGGCARV